MDIFLGAGFSFGRPLPFNISLHWNTEKNCWFGAKKNKFYDVLEPLFL